MFGQFSLYADVATTPFLALPALLLLIIALQYQKACPLNQLRDTTRNIFYGKKPSSLILVILMTASGLLPTACGGSGGGGGGTPAPAAAPPPSSSPPSSSPLPAAPTNITINWSGFSAQPQGTLNWDPVPDATSYNIYYATEPGLTKSNYTSKAGATKITGANPPYPITGLASSTTYAFIVTAVNANGEGASSVEITVTPWGLTVTSTRQNKLTISWEFYGDEIPVKGFRVYDGTGAKVKKCNTAETPPVINLHHYQMTCDIPPFAENVTMTYTMTSYDNAIPENESAQSNTITANKHPIPNITAIGYDRRVQFTSQSSDPEDGKNITHFWTFSDSQLTSSNTTVLYTFATAGQHTITLTVTDNQGAQTSIQMNLNIP